VVWAQLIHCYSPVCRQLSIMYSWCVPFAFFWAKKACRIVSGNYFAVSLCQSSCEATWPLMRLVHFKQRLSQPLTQSPSPSDPILTKGSDHPHCPFLPLPSLSFRCHPLLLPQQQSVLATSAEIPASGCWMHVLSKLTMLHFAHIKLCCVHIKTG